MPISCHPIVMIGRQASVLSNTVVSASKMPESIGFLIQIILSRRDILCWQSIQWVFGNLRGRKGMWGNFGGSTTKITPHLHLAPEFPRVPIQYIGLKHTVHDKIL